MYAISVAINELLFMPRRELKVNWERPLNLISQHPLIFSCALSPTIKDCDILIVNQPIRFVGNRNNA
jgi:hypothetical protein